MARLLASDFFRRFAGGFALGAVAMVLLMPADSVAAMAPLAG